MLRKVFLANVAAVDASPNFVRCQQTQLFPKSKIDLLIGVRSEALRAAVVALIDLERRNVKRVELAVVTHFRVVGNLPLVNNILTTRKATMRVRPV